MSYVRFSGGAYGYVSDVYCYEHVAGYWAIHVNDGQDFDEPTPGAAADRLEKLRAEGKEVPQFAIDELREEAATKAEGADHG